MTENPQNEAIKLRALIAAFIKERLEAKLDKLSPDDPKYHALTEQYQYSTWLEDAARRVGQIQSVTHTLKAIHPDARGTNLYVTPSDLPQHEVLGSHDLPANFSADVVGNAAALDVYKFLKLSNEAGQSLLALACANDAAFTSALSEDAGQAQQWRDAFAGLVASRGNTSSHQRAKQVYWMTGDDPLNDEHYHLLAPLYASSLSHQVFQQINQHRFGEEAKAAREARRKGEPHDTGYYDYPALAVQKLGGTKPQNISQLNSERGGNNYLLASLPPRWDRRLVTPPLRTDSVFPRFSRRREVWQTVRALQGFLVGNPPKNLRTRETRFSLTSKLVDELLQFSAEFWQLPAGWSKAPECRLAEAEALWLDPYRTEEDEEFRKKWRQGDWKQEIRERFANWLNRYLRQVGLEVGDPEHRQWNNEVKQTDDWREWLKHLEKELDQLQKELCDE
ncbi:type I-F CRISPR-associated protein Csy1 [Pokkaliibacter sp. CJK22405]|uniref:type I-F CRISPR-associated protein Csy1 n=1 Tax=Pokkaliibacter sp. CJK22405 TaxID=3384615 RepID=UPI00398538D2